LNRVGFDISIGLLVIVCAAGCINKQPNEVVVLSALDREFSESILDDVSDELNIPIRKKFDFESNKTVGLANEIIQNQNRPRADLFWNNEILHTIRLERLGLLEQYISPQASRFPASFRSKSNHWYALAARCRVLIINTDLMPDLLERPTSVADLTDPKYASRCTAARPLFGTSATHAAVLFDLMGGEKAKLFFGQIASNCKIQGGNKQVAEKVASGEFLFGLTDTDDAVIELEKGRPVAIVFPDQSPEQRGALLIPNTLCLIKNGPNPSAARKVLDRLLHSDVETRLSRGRSAQIPLATDINEPFRLTDLQQLKTMDVDFAAAAAVWPEAVKVLAELFPVGG
jgi:iron(III) transport system substrate-binding protein